MSTKPRQSDASENSLELALAAQRGRFMGLAYRMSGSRSDAEDILQDAYIKIQSIDHSEVHNPEAFLVTMISRMCLDKQKSAHSRREVYVGPWLPEPILDAEELTPHSSNELADDLSFALLLTLQKLSAAERASFLLHDVFDIPFTQVSRILNKSEAACRQLATRARKSIHADRPSSTVSPDEHASLLAQFAEAASSGNTEQLANLLCEDVIAYTDGGGQKISALRPIYGAAKVSRFFVGITRKFLARNNHVEIMLGGINGTPGLLIKNNESIEETVSIKIEDSKIKAFYVVRNPQKLQTLNLDGFKSTPGLAPRT
ncbi:MAG: RNA polymerase sigma factor SigJ [Gammaproteobacteria bacterium]